VERAALVWHDALAAYDLGDGHPLNPLRLILTVRLMDAYGLLESCPVIEPRRATEREIGLVHARGYIEAVHEASDWGGGFSPRAGLGTPDNPIYPGMHDIAALTCGASIVALEEVVAGRCLRTFSPAGGMHHAHKARAAGFSVYNDAAVAIAVAREKDPGLRILYLDIDAHHGDGVQEAFYSSRDVMTISVHESGISSFPGTGFPIELGTGEGEGFAVNVPLPEQATDVCFDLAFREAVVPLARAFRPDVIVAQLGADAHHADPQTGLGMTLPGYRGAVKDVIQLADELCSGRVAALGGGGYHVAKVVPLAWTWVMAELLGVKLDDALPESWRADVASLTGTEPPCCLGDFELVETDPAREAALLDATASSVAQVREALFPLHGLA
jgi:acetoin utilization protein AcuC